MRDSSITVMHVISNLHDGGAEGALYRLCVYSAQYNHVVVCMMDEGKYGPLLATAGISLHCLHMPQGKLTWKAGIHFWKLLRRVRPDLVQTWMYHADLIGGVMARLSGVRKVFWGIRHGNLTPGTVKNSTLKVARLCARLSKWVPTRIVSCSQQAMEAHVSIGYGVRQMTVIPNGYELSRYAPDALSGARLRAEWRIVGNTFLIGMVARYDPQKDHSNLMAALQQLKREGRAFHCLLVGTGMEGSNAELQHLLQKFDVTNVVSLLGRRNDVPAVMNALDVHVLSSLGEAFPNVVAEAMACGTPCVTTDVGDASYIVGDSGWVVPSQNAQALAKAVSQAMVMRETAPDLWLSRKESSRKRIVENFSVERMVGAYSEIWK